MHMTAGAKRTHETYLSGRPQMVGWGAASSTLGEPKGELMAGMGMLSGGTRGGGRGLERDEGGLEGGRSSSRETSEGAELVRTAG